MRQVMDYYYLLKSDAAGQRDEVTGRLASFGLDHTAGALMWLLHEKLGLEEQYLICGMNEKEGRFVLGEIEQTGNFGRTDSRFVGMSKLSRMTKHGVHLLLHYPSEVIWTPIWLMFHKAWKWDKKRRIREQWSQE